MINLYLLISLMILPRAYPGEVRIGPGGNKYVRIYHYYLYQNQERLPFLSSVYQVLAEWSEPLRLDTYGLSHNAFLRVIFRK